ncbi:hypothetical protein EYC84_009545 [Monilinia fructicola]|uniref:Nudix hydrolase domain-containing protein n=1 Tax=Monilinia fructicola TaxID=38448 RepID=A0A5M9J8Y9_MONFR|nr:hypothetical protein EYC84_009545 [Monilinia fructicola]
MTNLPPITDRSYGMITMRYLPSLQLSTPPPPPTPANTEVLLIQQKTVWKSVPPFWCFPKGHAESGDASTLHTAIRELEEETSLKAKLEDGQDAKEWDGSFSERYINPVRKNGKEVRFWPALLPKEEGEKEIKIQEKEVAGYKWCSWEEAVEKMTFDESKETFKRALAMFEGHGKVHEELKAKV